MSLKKTTIAELRTQVKNYVDYTVDIKKTDPSEIFLSATMSMETLKKIMESHKDCSGIRIYLTKETSHDSGVKGDIWPLIVPVKKGDNGLFTDLLNDSDMILESGDMGNFDCRNPPCATAHQGNKLL